MEARFRDEVHRFHGVGASNMRGKRSMEWDLNQWSWDGDLFVASSLNPVPSINEKGKIELEKKRRVILIDDDNSNNEDAATFSLKVGLPGIPVTERDVENFEGNGGKKNVIVGGSASRAICQVQDCAADLSKAKDYHRRHKVCEMHSKATKSLVGNVLQRFCQQCSRFHVLQEFDEGRRSCRRRLAGHNKRRRKTNPDAVGNGNSVNHDQNNSSLLISLLRILSNMHSTKADQATDQDLLSHLLRSLGSQAAEAGGRDLNGPDPSRPTKQNLSVHESGMPEKVVLASDVENMQTVSSMEQRSMNNHPLFPEMRDSNAGQVKLNNFDLNDVYNDSDDGGKDAERSTVVANAGTSSPDCPSWVQQDSQQSSPPQTSVNSDSASAQSPSSSSSDTQSCTDRILFKLFGKEPNEFPLVLRGQILDWLSHSPTDIESYIRPGCIILTIYLRQSEAAWEDLLYDLSCSLNRLLDLSDDMFWRTGWLFVSMRDQIAFIHNGQVVVDTFLPLRSNNYSKILSVKPIAVSSTQRAQFVIKGTNLSRRASRILCAIEGKYMAQEDAHELTEEVDNFLGLSEVPSVNFSCSIPPVIGRGFIEIEDHGFSSSFFPFIVADEDVCLEIRMLEDVLELDDEEIRNIDSKNQAMDFIHEIGWLLHRSQVKSRLDHLDPNTDLFPLRRFKWLMEFSIDHEWCAVVKKLLNIMVSGLVSTGEHSSLNVALSEMGLLHSAVRRNSTSLVKLLLLYVPESSGPEKFVDGNQDAFLFRPDARGPAGLTPLHIAAGIDGSEEVLDLLTDDPGLVGIEAWKNARDRTGFIPEDYARLRGHYSYIHLVQKKINKRSPATGYVVVDITRALAEFNNKNVNQKQSEGLSSSFEIGQMVVRQAKSSCELCSKKLAYTITSGRSMSYRPAMLSMVAIAAVCVCVALLFKSCPEVLYIFRPFRWEMLDYGSS